MKSLLLPLSEVPIFCETSPKVTVKYLLFLYGFCSAAIMRHILFISQFCKGVFCFFYYDENVKQMDFNFFFFFLKRLLLEMPLIG